MITVWDICILSLLRPFQFNILNSFSISFSCSLLFLSFPCLSTYIPFSRSPILQIFFLCCFNSFYPLFLLNSATLVIHFISVMYFFSIIFRIPPTFLRSSSIGQFSDFNGYGFRLCLCTIKDFCCHLKKKNNISIIDAFHFKIFEREKHYIFFNIIHKHLAMSQESWRKASFNRPQFLVL